MEAKLKEDDPPLAVPDSEQALIGTVLRYGMKEDLAIAPEAFTLEGYSLLWSAMLRPFYRGESVSFPDFMKTTEWKIEGEMIGGEEVLQGLLKFASGPDNLAKHRDKIVECMVRRILLAEAERIALRARTEKRMDHALADSQIELQQIAKLSPLEGFSMLPEIARENEEYLQNVYGRGSMITGIPTGFMRMNAITQGYQRGDLIILAGRPGMGKSAFALNTASYLAISQSYTVAFFSLESPKSQLGFRIQCAEARVNLRRLREGRLSKEEKKALFYVGAKMRDAKLFIDDTPRLSFEDIARRARQLRSQWGVNLVIVDHIGLLGERIPPTRKQIGEMSMGLKVMARELDIPVMALSQLSRECEKRKDHEPRLSDLRDAGELEQNADVVIFLHRPEYYDPETEEKNLCDVIVAKQRNGPTDRFRLGWSEETTRFSDLSQIIEMPEK